MKATTSYCKSTGIIQKLMLLVILSMISLLAGCSHQTTISEGNTYLQAQVLQAQLQSYQMRLKDNQKRLTAVIPEVSNPNPQIPPKLSGPLAQFLLDNDCSKIPPKETGLVRSCIQTNQIKLIQTTRKLEEAQMTQYMSQMTINQLIGNINTVVSGMNDPDSDKGVLGLHMTLPKKDSSEAAP